MPESDTQVACPHCGANNTAPVGGAPFFCIGCKAIVDPKKTISKSSAPASRGPDGAGGPGGPGGFSGPSAAVDRPAASDSHADPADRRPGQGPDSHAPASSPANYVSRYAASAPRDTSGPAGGPSVAGSVYIGLLLAAVAGIGLGVAAAMLGESVVRIPIVFPLLVGWGIKRALALGSGGGTPDRGPVIGGTLFLVVLASFGVTRYVEYRAIASRAATRFDEAFGMSASAALENPKGAIDAMKLRHPPHEGIVTLGNGVKIDVDDAAGELSNARAAGRPPREPYDVELLAQNGGIGFLSHLKHATADGQYLRLFGKAPGVRFPGFAILALWIIELALLAIASFARVE